MTYTAHDARKDLKDWQEKELPVLIERAFSHIKDTARLGSNYTYILNHPEIIKVIRDAGFNVDEVNGIVTW